MRIRDVDHLVERLVKEWSRFDHDIISAAVTQWPTRTRACVKADGGHFEHLLWQVMNNHTDSVEITESVARVVKETCVFDV